MKYYLECEYKDSDDQIWSAYVVAETKPAKDCYVVFVDSGEPSLARVKRVMDELEALTSNIHFKENLQYVDLSEYYKKQKAEIQKQSLLLEMKSEMEKAKMEENLKKHSADSPRMKELYDMYSKLTSSRNVSDEDEEEA